MNPPTNPVSLAPAALNLIVPQEVRYDGVQPTPRGNLLQFTNLQAGPAHGATFYVLEKEATSVVLARLTAQIRRSFREASAQPRSPISQRHPRRVAASEINHY